jgi:hypothetical protein
VIQQVFNLSESAIEPTVACSIALELRFSQGPAWIQSMELLAELVARARHSVTKTPKRPNNVLNRPTSSRAIPQSGWIRASRGSGATVARISLVTPGNPLRYDCWASTAVRRSAFWCRVAMSRAFPRAREQRTLHTGLPLFAPKNINSLAANDFDTQDALADRLRWARLLAVRGPFAGDAAPVYVEARSWRIVSATVSPLRSQRRGVADQGEGGFGPLDRATSRFPNSGSVT